MAEGKFKMTDIKGLTPGIDSTQSNELFALGGRNYVFDSLGVKSPFGNRLLSPIPLGQPRHVQGVRLRLRGGDHCFTFVAHGIIEWDEAAGGFQFIYRTHDTTLNPYRWTFEYLNGYMYFAHPEIGLLVYNLDTLICLRHEDSGEGTPEQIMSITQNNGRLIAMSPNLLSWSAPSNGLSFVPTFGGAGFQVIAERVPGDPIMVSSYGRGVLTWTTGGVMRSEFSGDAAVYRHRTLNIEYRPINSFCTARIDEDTLIILDERGLFQSRGESFTPYAPLFNEFLINFLQENPYRNGNNLRMEWDDRQRRLYISYSDSYASPVYEKCFVYYPPLDKWGEFNESHYGILPIKVSGSERADDYFGFVDSDGCVRYWKGTGSRQATIADSSYPVTTNLYQPTIDKPGQFAFDDVGQELGTTLRISTVPRAGITTVEGYYAPEATSPHMPELTGLNALIKFGSIRMSQQSVADEMAEITSVLIRNVKSGDSDVLTTDFNLVPDGVDDEDYNDLIGGEDLGTGPLNYINHTLELIGTIDADSEYDRQAPDLIDFQSASRMFSCSCIGIWHNVEIGAESVGEAFHIKTFEVTGTSAGRYL